MTNFSTENNGPELVGGIGSDVVVFVEVLLNLGVASTEDLWLLVTLLSLRDELLIDKMLGLVSLELCFCVLEKPTPLDVIGVENLTLGVYVLPVLRADNDPSKGFLLERALGVPRCSSNELDIGRELSNDGKGFRVSWSVAYDNTDCCGLSDCNVARISFSSW